MTKRNAARILIAVLTLAASALAQTDAQKAYAKIKTMPGTWEGQGPDGHAFQVTYTMTAAGSAVMSEIKVPNHEMVSMFHLDGSSRLLMTHYCAAMNQPRMQASLSPDGKIITFNFVDATNLPSADAGHMEKMVLTLIDDNHHTEEWVFVDHGKQEKKMFDLHRKS